MDTLLGQIAFQFTTKTENVATEALGYVLKKSMAAREALRGHVRRTGVSLPEGINYSTQSVGEKKERPDLVGTVDGIAEPIIIEAKFWAGFTDNQPGEYLKRLAPRGVLVFVAPAARLPSLWNSLRTKVANEGFRFEECDTTVEAHRANVGGKSIVLTSWRGLLDEVRGALDAVDERQLSEDVAQLQGLCQRADADSFLPLTAEELTAGYGRRIREFGSLANDAVEALKLGNRHRRSVDVDARPLASTNRLRYAKWNGGWGRYMLLNGVPTLLACDIRLWLSHGVTPIWLTVWGSKWNKDGKQKVDAHRALVSYSAAHPGLVVDYPDDGYPAVGITLCTGMERDEVLAHMLDQLEEIAKLVGHLAGAGPEGPPPTMEE